MPDALRSVIAARILTLRQHHAHNGSPGARTTYSQKMIAGHIGVSQQRYSDYETGKADIPLRRLRQIYRYLQGNFAEIVALYAELPEEEEEEDILLLTAV